jgi:hypothetical protein
MATLPLAWAAGDWGSTPTKNVDAGSTVPRSRRGHGTTGTSGARWVVHEGGYAGCAAFVYV